MSTLKLTDSFGLVIDATPSSASAFAKYLKSPQSLIAEFRTKRPIAGLQIGQDPFGAQSIGICFTQPVGLGVAGVELTISLQVVATVAIKKGEWLFNAATDPFRDKIATPSTQAFVSFTIKARLDPGVSTKACDLQFGFTNGTWPLAA